MGRRAERRRNPPRASRDDALNALANIYRSGDGRWFTIALVNEDREAPGFFRAIDRSDMLEDPRFKDTPSRRQNAGALREFLDGHFASRDWAHWQSVLQAQGLTFSAAARVTDLTDDAQLRHAGAVIDGPDGPTIGSPVFVDGEEKRAPMAAPGLGANSRKSLPNWAIVAIRSPRCWALARSGKPSNAPQPGQAINKPPSILIAWPVTLRAASEAR